MTSSNERWYESAGYGGAELRPTKQRLASYCVDAVPDPLFVTVSGAHLYGFPSPDSDVDLRGAFLASTREFLGLDGVNETLQSTAVIDECEVELVAHELGKCLRLLTRSNGYVLEQILSPLVIYTTPMHDELCSIARGSFCRRVFKHYRGFGMGIWREYQRSGLAGTIKQVLYAYRVLMTGIVLLEEGILEPNVKNLGPRFGIDLNSLISAKSFEKVAWQGPIGEHEQCIEALFDRLEHARDKSVLPEDLPNKDRLNDFLIRCRIEALQTG